MTKNKKPDAGTSGQDNQIGKPMSDNIVQHLEGELRVSSEVIAERVDAQHKNVMELVRANQGDLESFGPIAFETRLGIRGGRPLQIAHLNEQQSTLLITFMRNSGIVKAFKLELVKQFYAMRQALTGPAALTEDEVIHQALQITSRKIKELEAKAAEDAPKVGYVDTFVADGDLLLLRTVAKSLGMQEKDLRNQLEARGWIYKDTASRWSASINQKVYTHRYSAFSHKTAYFTPVPNHEAPRFRGEVMHTLKVTPLGAEAIARNFKQVAA